MQHKTHYDTVSDAIDALRRQGFTADFNLQGKNIVADQGKFDENDFEIVDVYRYEGNTDPADEAAVYAIKCSNGLKGILVTGYGASADISFKKLNK